MREIVIIAHDIRSSHNIGSLLRTADGFGVQHVYFTGYTPFPPLPHDDPRLPHIANKLGRQIAKTALGAEQHVAWSSEPDILQLLEKLSKEGYQTAALEQDPDATPLPDYNPTQKVALLLGREVDGVEPNLLAKMDRIIEIPMFGTKESFNVIQAAAAALYHLRFAK